MEAIWDFVSNILVALGLLFTTLSSIFILISGLVSVFFGRRLFWVFVATLGFMIGLFFSDNVLVYLPVALEPFKEFIRLGFAVLVAFIALGLQRFGVVVAGGIAVGVLTYYLAGELGVSTLIRWASAGVVGLLAAALLWFSHDWMLIIITAFTGALIAVVGANQINTLPASSAPWLWLILIVAGIFYQYREMGRTRTEAILVAAPSESGKPSARTRYHFFRRSAAGSSNAPVTLIESTNQPPAAAVPVASPTASPAILPAVPAVVAPVAAAPAAVAPAAVAPVVAATAAAVVTSPALAAPPPAKTAAAGTPASTPAAAPVAALPMTPATTQNVDGQIVVLKNNSGKWMRLPRWQRASQSEMASLPDSQLQPLEPGQPQSKNFFKSAPEAYG